MEDHTVWFLTSQKSSASWGLASSSSSVISWAIPQCRTGQDTPWDEQSELLPEHQVFGAHPPDFNPVPFAFFKCYQMLPWHLLMLMLAFAWVPLRQDVPIFLRLARWNEEVHLIGGLRLWKMRSTHFFILINKACFGDRRLITERDGGGNTQWPTAGCFLEGKPAASLETHLYKGTLPLPSTATSSLSRSSQVWLLQYLFCPPFTDST